MATDVTHPPALPTTTAIPAIPAIPPIKDEQLMELGRVAASVAHDFDNALTAIVSRASLLRAGSDPKVTTHAEAILRAARSASQVVERIRSQLRPPAALDKVRLSLGTLVGEALEMAAERAKRRGIMLHAVQGPTGKDEPPLTLGNHAELLQVVVNLLHNAIDAADREVTSRVTIDGAICIVDDGPGIPPHLAELVFEPFYTTRENGTGIGLYQARRVTEAHGGKLRLEARHPGTAAILELPLVDPEEAARHPGPRPLTDLELTPQSAGARVLVVDDDEATRQALHILFEASGHQVTSVASANQAVLAFHELRPDLVVTDLYLGHKQIGLHLDRMRALDPRVPIIVVSGLGSGQHPPDLHKKAAALFEKPVSPGRLLDAARLLIAEHIAFRAQRREG